MNEYLDIPREFDEMTENVDKAILKIDDVDVKSKKIGLDLVNNDSKEYTRWGGLFKLFTKYDFIGYIRYRRWMLSYKYISETGIEYSKDKTAMLSGYNDEGNFSNELKKKLKLPDYITPGTIAKEGDKNKIYRGPMKFGSKAEYKEEMAETSQESTRSEEYHSKIIQLLIEKYNGLSEKQADSFIDFLLVNKGIDEKTIIYEMAPEIVDEYILQWLEFNLSKLYYEVGFNKREEKMYDKMGALDIETRIKIFNSIEDDYYKRIDKRSNLKRNNKMEDYYNYFKPRVPFGEYFKYIQEFNNEKSLTGYDDYYHLRKEYDIQKEELGDIEHFKKKYDYYVKTKKKMSFEKYYQYWDMYKQVESNESYDSFRVAFAALNENFINSLNEYAEINREIKAKDFLKLYQLFQDENNKELCYKFADNEIFLTADELEDVAILNNLFGDSFDIIDVYKSFKRSHQEPERYAEEFKNYLENNSDGMPEDYADRLEKYIEKYTNATLTQFFKYYDYYKAIGGKGNLKSFDKECNTLMYVDYEYDEDGDIKKQLLCFDFLQTKEARDFKNKDPESYFIYLKLYDKIKTESCFDEFYPFAEDHCDYGYYDCGDESAFYEIEDAEDYFSL